MPSRTAIMLFVVACLSVGVTAGAQTPANPFEGSAPPATATAEPIALSLKEAVARGLQYNLGLLLQEEAVKTAHGAQRRVESRSGRVGLFPG